MSSPPRVAVTGVGAVTALGHDVPSTWRAALAGECGIGPIANIPTERLAARTAAEVKGFDPEAHFERRRLPLLDRAAQLTLVAAREAMAMAGHPKPEPARAGVLLGAAIGQGTFDRAYLSFYGERANKVPPLTVPRAMPSAAASHISMEFGLRGPSFSPASACASAGHALGMGMHLLRAGMVDLVVSGGGDASVVVGVLKGWEALRVLSPDVCRPFSRDRAGLVIGEGAGVLVLERMDDARARGATVLAELAGCGMTADAADITAPDEQGAAAAMQGAIADAGLTPDQVGYINAHGTGTRLNDKTETAAIRRVFREHTARLAVSSSKSMFGHCMSACGGIELVMTVLALHHGVIPPTVGFREHDPECDIDCVPNQARPAPIEAALSNSFAFGGLNAVLAVKRAA